MQDIEFTIENGKLYLLQTRNGKRTAKAAIKLLDLVHEQLITREEAVSKVEVKSIDQLLHPNFNEESLKQATVVSKMGLPASRCSNRKSSLLLKKQNFKLKMVIK